MRGIIGGTMARGAVRLKRALHIARLPALLLAPLLLAGCETVSSIAGTDGRQQGTPGFVRGFLGGIAAEEPRAVLAAREVLSAGGSATDAAVALGFALSVTLPSRASLGGGGVCIVWSPERNQALGFDFTARAAGGTEPRDDRPAAVPMLARGLFAVHARGGGRLNFERLVSPAEAMARFGVPASRALVRDLAAVAGPLTRDPNVALVFAPGGRLLEEADQLVQPVLANTLGQIRSLGPGDLHQGLLGRRLAEASIAAGGTISLDDLRAAVPRAELVPGVRVGNDLAFAAPGPGGAEAVEAFRTGRVEGGVGFSGASTGFAVVDREGNSAACALSMNNLFGTGRIAPGTGVLLAAAPTGRIVPPPLPAMIIANDRIREFRFAGAASGGPGAPMALGSVARAAGRGAGLAEAVAAPRPGLSQGEGRVSAIHCPLYLPRDPRSCVWAADPRGAGFAVGAD